MTPEPNPSQGTFKVAAYKGCSFCGSRWTGDAKRCPTCQDAGRCAGCGKEGPHDEDGDFGILCKSCNSEINSQNQGA